VVAEELHNWHTAEDANIDYSYSAVDAAEAFVDRSQADKRVGPFDTADTVDIVGTALDVVVVGMVVVESYYYVALSASPVVVDGIGIGHYLAGAAVAEEGIGIPHHW